MQRCCKSRSLRWLAACGLLWLGSGCAEPPPPKPPIAPPAAPELAPEPVPTLSGPPGLPSTVVAELAAPDREVRFARNGRHGVLLTRREGRWLSGGLALDDKGRAELVPAGEAGVLQALGEAPQGEMVASLQPVGSGFVLAWASASGESTIKALKLDAKGSAQGAVQTLRASSTALRWVEVLPTAKGALLLWESGSAGSSELYVARFGANEAPARVASDVSGWHASAHPQGASVAWVSARGNDRGLPHFASIAASGKPSPAVALGDQASALLDIQTARVGAHHLVAWTDARSPDTHVYLARLDESGALQGKPKPALAPVGSHGLVALLAAQDGARALLAWEPVLGLAEGPRPIQLTTLDAQGQPGARAELELWAPRGTPQLVADGPGFTALTLAPVQPRGSQSYGQGPHYVRFDHKLAVQAAEPIRIAELAQQSVAIEGVPGIVRTLQCQGQLCTVVAVGDGTPALLAITSLPMRRSSWRAPAKLRQRVDSPQARALEMAESGSAPIAATSATRLLDGRTLLAWVTHIPPGKDGLSPPRAELAYRFVSAKGKVGPKHVLSRRAISLGGVKVIALRPNKRFNRRNPAVALIAWAGPNSGSSQMFVTQIGGDEKKLKQRTVTKQRRRQGGPVANEVGDVDIALDPSGNVVCSWSDSRDGNAEIYLARLSPMLEKNKMDRRISKGDGPSTEPRLLVAGERTFLAWSDVRGEAKAASIFVTQFATGSLATRQQPAAVSRGAAHARTPRWAGAEGDGAWLSWIEETTGASTRGELVIASPGGAQRRVQLGTERTINSATLRCAKNDGCRGAMLSSIGGTLEIYGFRAPAEGTAPIRPHELALLPGGSPQDLGLTATDPSLAELYFRHRHQAGEAVRRLSLQW